MDKIKDAKIITYPYSHICIDNFLSFEFANELYKRLIKLEKGGIDNSILDICNLDELKIILEDKFKLQLSLFGRSYLISPPGSYKPYDLSRETIKVILFMNKNYFRDNGGELHLLDNKSNTVEKVIYPNFNRLVILFPNKTNSYGISVNKNGFHRRSLEFYYNEEK